MSDPVERIRVCLVDRYTIKRELGSGGMASGPGVVELNSEAEAPARRWANRLEGRFSDVFQDVSARSAAEPTVHRRNKRE